MTYSEKLRSPIWQKRRLQILERDGWRCRSCHTTEKNLQVHHLVYSRHTNPWDYPEYCYQTLCEDCHQQRQELTDKSVNALRIAIKDVPTERLELIAVRLMNAAMGEVE